MRERLHLVTDDAVLARPDFVVLAAEALEAGRSGVALHLRGPHTAIRRLLRLARALEAAVAVSGARLVVNDRVDLALALGISSVHLGQRSLPLGEVRALLGEEATLGVSVHSREEAAAALEQGADYLVVGTMFATSTHPERRADGPRLLASVRKVASAPLVAIGGITPERVADVVSNGADGVAVVSGVWGGERPGRAVEVYLEALKSTRTDEPRRRRGTT